MNKPLVSVIVPVYKVEKYLHECVNSLVNQTYKNIEIILVDDKSPDASGEMCDALATKYERIVVIHKAKNEGLNMARKTGFEASHGEYVTFLDSDDFFYKNNVERSLNALLENGADTVVYGSQEFSDQDNKKEINRLTTEHQEILLDTKKQRANFAFYGEGDMPNVQYITAWGKLFSREVIQSIDWDIANYRNYEDNFWTPQALLNSKKVVVISDLLIHYRRNIEYGAESENLGNRLTGNSVNGKPVGYVEFVDLVKSFYLKLTIDHKLGTKLNKETEWKLFLIKTSRVDNLVKAGILDSENNMEYVVPFLPKYIASKNQHIKNLDASIEYLHGKVNDNENHIKHLEDQIGHLQDTLEAFNGVKFSVKHVAKNIKRKILNPKD